MNRRLRGGISAAVCAMALAGCGGGGGGDSSATPASQAQNNAVQPLKAAAPKIADVGITPASALRPGTKVNFIVSGTFPSATTYVWDFGDSSPLSNGVSATHTYSKLGTFTVKVTATDTSNQKSVETRSVEIVQNQPPIVSGAVSIGGKGPGNVFDTGQMGSTASTVKIVINATDPQGGSLTYKWMIDGVAYGERTANDTLTYTFETGGSHVATVVVTDEYGGQTSRDFLLTVRMPNASILPLSPVDPTPPGGYAVWKATYTGQAVGRIRVSADGTAWALPINKPQMLRSKDNGASWQELTLPKDDDGKGGNGFIDIAVADNKNLWVVGCPQQKWSAVEGGSSLDFAYAGVMHSSDGGSSWENVRTGVLLGTECIRGIQFVGQNGWLVSARGNVAKTTDGGKTWDFQAGTGIDARRMQFIDARNGWIIGAELHGSKMQIARTTDGGTTWTTSQIPDAQLYSYGSVFFVDAKTGYASGSQWSSTPYPVLKTIDGGATWSALTVPKSSAITDLLFITPTYGYALDMFGDVYDTKDGGLNWAKIGVTSSEFGLTSFARGDNGKLLGTSSSAVGGGILRITPL